MRHTYEKNTTARNASILGLAGALLLGAAGCSAPNRRQKPQPRTSAVAAIAVCDAIGMPRFAPKSDEYAVEATHTGDCAARVYNISREPTKRVIAAGGRFVANCVQPPLNDGGPASIRIWDGEYTSDLLMLAPEATQQLRRGALTVPLNNCASVPPGVHSIESALPTARMGAAA